MNGINRRSDIFRREDHDTGCEVNGKDVTMTSQDGIEAKKLENQRMMVDLVVKGRGVGRDVVEHYCNARHESEILIRCKAEKVIHLYAGKATS